MKTMAMVLLAVSATMAAQSVPPAQPAQPPRPGFTLTTTSFQDGGIIPNQFTAAAEGVPISPQLSWSNVPEGTVGFVLISTDPDVTVDKGTVDFPHWIFFNIPASVRELREKFPAEAQLPDGSIQLMNRRKSYGYLPPGASAAGPYHHYTFTLYALDTKLALDGKATQAEVMAAMQGHVLGRAVVFGRFHR